MKKPQKAVMLSALVFPGSGHFLLGKYFTGVLLAAITLVSFFFLVQITFDVAKEVSFRIQYGEIPLDVFKIRAAILTQLTERADQLGNMSTYPIIICWLIGIVDSYRLGRLETRRLNDQAEQAKQE